MQISKQKHSWCCTIRLLCEYSSITIENWGPYYSNTHTYIYWYIGSIYI